ncbi:Uncharacterized protein OBRU01_22657, partial [Operophtera brumata]
VAPAEVESVILQHSGVAECGVVGAPDEKAGELPTAFVVAKQGVTLSERDLIQFTNARRYALRPIKKRPRKTSPLEDTGIHHRV